MHIDAMLFLLTICNWKFVLRLQNSLWRTGFHKCDFNGHAAFHNNMKDLKYLLRHTSNCFLKEKNFLDCMIRVNIGKFVYIFRLSILQSSEISRSSPLHTSICRSVIGYKYVCNSGSFYIYLNNIMCPLSNN